MLRIVLLVKYIYIFDVIHLCLNECIRMFIYVCAKLVSSLMQIVYDIEKLIDKILNSKRIMRSFMNLCIHDRVTTYLEVCTNVQSQAWF